MKQLSPNVLALVAAIVVSASVLSIGVAKSPAGAVAAISAAATAVLVCVTAWYVVLTWRLVRAQDRSLTQAQDFERARATAEVRRQERQAVVRIWRLCLRNDVNWSTILSGLERLNEDSWEAVERSRESLREQAEALMDLSMGIANEMPDVPEVIHGKCWKVASKLMSASNILHSVSLAVAEVALEAHQADEAPDVKRVEVNWTAQDSPSLEGLEWPGVLAGESMGECQALLDELEGKTFSLIRAGSSA